jgi:hypothetical protein
MGFFPRRWRQPLLSAVLLAVPCGTIGCDEPPRHPGEAEAATALPEEGGPDVGNPTAQLSAPALLVAGLAEADAWARDGHDVDDARARPVLAGRGGCESCGRAWFRVAAEQPEHFAGALLARKDVLVVNATVRELVGEYGGDAAMLLVHFLGDDEAAWESAILTLARLPVRTDRWEYDLRGLAPHLVHEVRRHLAAAPADEGRRAVTLVVFALLTQKGCGANPEACLALLGGAGSSWRLPGGVTTLDLTAFLALADGAELLPTVCPALTPSSALDGALVAAVRASAEAPRPPPSAGERALGACLCARHALAGRRELATFFRARNADPMSRDVQSAVRFEAACP